MDVSELRSELARAYAAWKAQGVLSDADGKPAVFWHGTKADDFVDFDRRYTRTAADFYFTEMRETAEGYGRPIAAHLRAGNIFDLRLDEISQAGHAVLRAVYEEIGRDYGFIDVDAFTDAVTGAQMYQHYGGPGFQNAVINELRALGYDAVRMADAGFGGSIDESVIVFSADQIVQVDEHTLEPRFLSNGLLRAWCNEVRAEVGLSALDVFVTPPDILKVQMIEVDRQSRGQGAGSTAVRRLCALADECGLRITLTPGLKDRHHGTTSRNRLVRFYKRFGFKENRGARKDFTISEGLLREPQCAQAQGAVSSRRPRPR